MKVLNVFGGPGCGKSTLTSGLFERMKIDGYNVELVTEYAKDMVWEQRPNILGDQLYILAKQNRRLSRLEGKVDWVITDSPLIFGLVYAPSDYYTSYRHLLLDVWNSYQNVNIRLMRDPVTYQPIGRVQGSLTEAQEVDDRIEVILNSLGIPFDSFAVCPGLPDVILEFLGLRQKARVPSPSGFLAGFARSSRHIKI